MVKEKFEDHFIKKRNVIYEGTRFNSRKQEGEPVDSFITDLHALAEHCNYKDLHDEMIRDRIVVGLRDAVDVGIPQPMTVNTAQQRTQFAISAKNEDTLSEYANQPK